MMRFDFASVSGPSSPYPTSIRIFRSAMNTKRIAPFGIGRKVLIDVDQNLIRRVALELGELVVERFRIGNDAGAIGDEVIGLRRQRDRCNQRKDQHGVKYNGCRCPQPASSSKTAQSTRANPSDRQKTQSAKWSSTPRSPAIRRLRPIPRIDFRS